jgi:flavin reductase (DIM6/NTAB) family NADH-FMN oxidoreductase RutF
MTKTPDPVTATQSMTGPVNGDDIGDMLKLAFRHHPGGVAVITADAGSGPAGLTATSVVSLSVDPPLVGFSLSSLSSAAPTIAAADTVAIHLVDIASLEVARRFATSGVDRFAPPTQWSRLATGEPVLHGVDRWMRARVRNRVEAGTATFLVVEVLAMSVASATPARGVVYHDRSWFSLDPVSRVG